LASCFRMLDKWDGAHIREREPVANDEHLALLQRGAAGCSSRNIYREKVTGARADRRELLRMLRRLAPGDLVTVTWIDRLARDTTDLLVIARDMQGAGAGIRSLAEPYRIRPRTLPRSSLLSLASPRSWSAAAFWSARHAAEPMLRPMVSNSAASRS